MKNLEISNLKNYKKIEAFKLKKKHENLSVQVIKKKMEKYFRKLKKKQITGRLVTFNINNFAILKYWSFEISTKMPNLKNTKICILKYWSFDISTKMPNLENSKICILENSKKFSNFITSENNKF